MSLYEEKYTTKNGFKIFRMCDNIMNYPLNAWKLVKSYFGGLAYTNWIKFLDDKIHDDQLFSNIDLIRDLTDYEYEVREKRLDQ